MIALTKDKELNAFIEKVRLDWSGVTDDAPQVSNKLWKKYGLRYTCGQFLDFEVVKEVHSQKDQTSSEL